MWPPLLRAATFALAWVAFADSLPACASGGGSSPRLAPPEPSTTLGPGDIFRLQIVGEKELPDQYEVASDGTVDLPYLHVMLVGGLEPQQLARLVRKQLMDRRILSDPSVVIRVEEYRSKRVTVLGQVQKPGNFAFQPGMTLVQAVSVAGGFNAIAKRGQVRLTRVHKAGSRTVVIDVDAINDGTSEDILLQAGDRIFVDERVF